MAEKLTGAPSGPTARLPLPRAPALVVHPGGEGDRAERLRAAEALVAPGVGHEAALVLVVNLADQDEPAGPARDDHTGGGRTCRLLWASQS